MLPEHKREVEALVLKIRNRDKSCTSRFLAMYELLPKSIWKESVLSNLMTPKEFQACFLVLKQYRLAQAKSAINDSFQDPTTKNI